MNKTQCMAEHNGMALANKGSGGRLGRETIWVLSRIFTNWFHWNQKRFAPLNYLLKNENWLNCFRFNSPRPTAEEKLTLANIALQL